MTIARNLEIYDRCKLEGMIAFHAKDHNDAV